MKLILWILALKLLAGCQVVAATESMEVLHGLRWQDDKLQVQVTSTGCTGSDSFQTEKNGDTIRILRVTPDYCRRLPFEVWIDLDGEVNKETRVLNPFTQP